MRILTVGTSCVDVSAFPVGRFPHPGGRLRLSRAQLSAAGNGLCTAVCLANLGVTSALLTAIGSDTAGEIVRSSLSSNRVKVFEPRTTSGGTSVSIVAVAPNSERRILSFSGASAAIQNADVLRAVRVFEPKVVVLQGLALMEGLLRTGPSAALVRALRDKIVILDPALRSDWARATWKQKLTPWMPLCSAFVPSADELVAMTGLQPSAITEARALLSVRSLCVKIGRRGAVLSTAEVARRKVPAFRVRALDSTGAGDCWTAGFAWALAERAALDTATLVYAAVVGNALGALAVQQFGAVPSRVSPKVVRSMVRKAPQP